MRAAEFLIEMSVRRKKAEQLFGGIESEFNLHLLKLMGFIAPEDTRNHWKKELRTWATKLSIITLKDDDRPVPVKDVFNWMYDEPFGGRELQNVEALLKLISEDYERNDTSSVDISTKLKSFHETFAQCIHQHDPCFETINQL